MDDKKPKWDENASYELGLYKLIIRVLGIWPLDHGIFPLLKNLIIIILQSIWVTIFLQNWMNKGTCGPILDSLDAIMVTTGSLMSILKIFLSRIHQKRIAYIVNTAVEFWRNVEDEQSRNIMLRYAYIGRMVLIVEMSGGYTAIMSSILSTLPTITVDMEVDNGSIPERNIPIFPLCWVSPETSTFIYLLFYFFICLNLFVVGTMTVAIDVFSFKMALHICGQCELLYRELTELDNDKSDTKQREKLAKFLEKHTRLLDLMDTFEAAFNSLILSDVGTNTFVICISEIAIIWGFKIGNMRLVLVMTIRGCLMYLQIFMYSYVGEKLSSSGNNLQKAIYNCSWYNMNQRMVKDLKFIMMRNNYPFYLTAGKIVSMNYENFKNIVKSMFSYLQIVRMMFDE